MTNVMFFLTIFLANYYPMPFKTVLDNPKLNASAASADIALAKRALEAIHPGYDRYAKTGQLNLLWTNLEASVQAGTTVLEMYRQLSLLLAAVRCDHTKAELPKSIDKERMAKPTFLPFRFKNLEGRMIVWSNHDSVPELTRGTEIVTLDGRPVSAWFSEIAKYIPIDGYTDHVVLPNMGLPDDFSGSQFEYFLGVIKGFPKSYTVTFRGLGETATQELTVKPINFAAWRELPFDGIPYRLNFKDAVSCNVSDDQKVATLRIDTFVNYRSPVDPKTIYEPIFQDLKDRGVQTLILDTRFNGGGSVDAQVALMRYLIRKPFRMFKNKYMKTVDVKPFKKHLSTWEPRMLDLDPNLFEKTDKGMYRLIPVLEVDGLFQEPMPNAFDGNLILLSSTSNASATCAMLAKLAETTGATIVGAETGGNTAGTTAFVMYFLTLPESGIVVRIPAFLGEADLEEPRDGYGVRPDVQVTLGVRELLAGNDPVLEKALDLARR